MEPAAAALPHAAPVRRDYKNYDYYVVHLKPRAEVQRALSSMGLGRGDLEYQGSLRGMPDHHIFRGPKSDDDVIKTAIRERKLRRRQIGGYDALEDVMLVAKQRPRMRLEKRVVPPPPGGVPRLRRASQRTPDPAAVERRNHIIATLGIRDKEFPNQWHLFNDVETGHDVNVTGLWLEGITGGNVTVAIVDDGLDMDSIELKENYCAECSYDFNSHNPVPRPQLSDDRHGTRCAGEVAAISNDFCGVGVAYNATVSGIRILSEPISDADEAEAMIYENQKNHIYSCSWGPRDDGRSMEAPGILIRQAMVKGIKEGRGGLGSIYVFASGNGAASGDNCNFDGYTNSIFSITIGAVDRPGEHPYYSEPCSAQLVVTYSSGGGYSIETTDVGKMQCTSGHGGTSAAAPLAAGIFTMVLQVRPDLTWRDLQYLVMDTAISVADPHGEADWKKTYIGKNFSHKFGYGKIDSYALVHKAKDWKLVKPQAWFFSPWMHVKQDIPQGPTGLISEFVVTEDMLKKANLARLEHVTVTMNVNHSRRGDLSVDLISPEKLVSHLSTARPNDEHSGGYEDWTFMSVVHWGEPGNGTWTLVVRDTKVNQHTGKVIDWHLKLWGESIDPDKAVPLALPVEGEDKDHDKTTSTGTAATAGPTATATATTAPTGTQIPGPAGAAKVGQLWLYGALCLIIVFCMGLGTYLWVARRRRLRNKVQDGYEFELVDDEDVDGLMSQEKEAAGGKKKRRTRGGELYDAFAGGSDEEEADDGASDEYRDRSAARLAGDDEAEQYVVGDESDDGDDGDDGEGGEKGESRPLREP